MDTRFTDLDAFHFPVVTSMPFATYITKLKCYFPGWKSSTVSPATRGAQIPCPRWEGGSPGRGKTAAAHFPFPFPLPLSLPLPLLFLRAAEPQAPDPKKHLNISVPSHSLSGSSCFASAHHGRQLTCKVTQCCPASPAATHCQEGVPLPGQKPCLKCLESICSAASQQSLQRCAGPSLKGAALRASYCLAKGVLRFFGGCLATSFSAHRKVLSPYSPTCIDPVYKTYAQQWFRS